MLTGLTLIESTSAVSTLDGFVTWVETIHFYSDSEFIGVGESVQDSMPAVTYAFSGSYEWRVEGSRGYLSTKSEDGSWLSLHWKKLAIRSMELSYSFL